MPAFGSIDSEGFLGSAGESPLLRRDYIFVGRLSFLFYEVELSVCMVASVLDHFFKGSHLDALLLFAITMQLALIGSEGDCLDEPSPEGPGFVIARTSFLPGCLNRSARDTARGA